MAQSSSDADLLSLDDSFLPALFHDGDDYVNSPFTDDEYLHDILSLDDSFLSDLFHDGDDYVNAPFADDEYLYDLLSLDDSFLSDLFHDGDDYVNAPFTDDECVHDLLSLDDSFLLALFRDGDDHDKAPFTDDECVHDLLSLDDSFIQAVFHDGDDDDKAPFTDDEYAQRLQFQETLYSSCITPQNPKDNDPSSSSSFCVLKVAATCPTPETEHLKDANETCELSWQVICEICAETRKDSQMFTNQKCRHSFCSDCVAKQVATKIQDSITVVPCPGLDCKSVLELDACRPWFPKDLLERWDQALCESMFLPYTKFYCPFKDCSAMLLVEDEEVVQQAVREAECPNCHRLFCAKCNEPWHPGIECEEYQNLNENERQREDLMAMEFAEEKKWKRCPNCRFYVERTEGCLHITCRCQLEFCYGCGEKWTSTHACCQTN